MKRRIPFLMFVIMLGMSSMPVAVAGGWAIVELTRPVPVVIVGKEVTIQFRVLGHGRPDAPQEGLEATVTLIHRESKARTSVSAVATADDPALYEASFTLKKAGAYKWSIEPAPYAATAMPTLSVYATAADAEKAEAAETNGPGTGVSILESAFDPARIVVAPGTTVEWTNTSVIPHQVVWSDLNLDDSGILETDGTYRLTFDEPGTYRYFCGPHPFMIGEIVVSEGDVGTPET
jgi:plastocyanin